MVQVLSAVRGYFVSLVKRGLVDVIVRIILKETFRSLMPLNLSQESQAPPLFAFNWKVHWQNKLSIYHYHCRDWTSCTNFFHYLVLLRACLPRFQKDCSIFSLRAYCLLWVRLVLSCNSSDLLSDHMGVCSPGITLKRVYFKKEERERALRFSNWALRVFWCTKLPGFGTVGLIKC